MKKWLKIMIIIGIIIIIPLMFIYFFQDKLLYRPWHDEESYEFLKGDERFKEIFIDIDDKKLHGWYKTNGAKNTPLIIFFHGNAENASSVAKYFLDGNVYKSFEGYDFLVIDYPGYGLSTGKPNQKDIFKMTLSVYDYAATLKTVDKTKIVSAGFSIGTGMATYLAANRDVSGLILISPYDEIRSLYNNFINIFYGPMKMLIKDKYETYKYAKEVKVLPIIFTSIADDVVDYNSSLRLADSFNKTYDTVILNEGSHIQYFSNKEVLNKIEEYLDDYLLEK